jgi:hypothetical protein
MKLRAQILAEDARRKAERQKKVPGAVPAGPPEPAPIEGVLESMWTPLPLVELILQGQTALGRLAALSHLDDSVMNLEEAAAMLMRVALEIEMITVSKMDLKEKVG